MRNTKQFIKRKNAMTPVAALLIFLFFVIIIVLILTTWFISFLSKPTLNCEGIFFQNITPHYDVIYIVLNNSNLAKIYFIDFFIDEVCKFSYSKKIKPLSEEKIQILVNPICIPYREIRAELKLSKGIRRGFCTIKNEVSS